MKFLELNVCIGTLVLYYEQYFIWKTLYLAIFQA